MEGALTFGKVRPFISRIERISILSDDSSYENYPSIRHVPYGAIDWRPVKGIGRAVVEFDKHADPRYPHGSLGDLVGDRFMAEAMEIWLGDASDEDTPLLRLDMLSHEFYLRSREAEALGREIGGEVGWRVMRAASIASDASREIDEAVECAGRELVMDAGDASVAMQLETLSRRVRALANAADSLAEELGGEAGERL